MPNKINKMIKKIKTMKIFKKKNKSYENDIQEDMAFTGFGTKERIETMNSCSHRRDIDYVKTSAMNYVDVKDMNVDGLKEKSASPDPVKTSAINSVDVKEMNVDGLKENLDSVKTSAMNSVDVNMNFDGLKEKASVGLDSVKTSAMNSVDVNNMNVDGLKKKTSVDVNNMNVDGLKEKASVGFDSLKKYLKNMNVNDIKSNAIVLNKKIDSSEHEFIREKSLSMDYGLKEIDSVEDHYLKRSLSMDSMDFNGINVNKEEWYYPRLESIREERECKPFEWIKKCIN